MIIFVLERVGLGTGCPLSKAKCGVSQFMNRCYWPSRRQLGRTRILTEEKFWAGRAARCVPLVAGHWIVHLFVVYGYRRADRDPEKPCLTERLFASVLCEACVVASGQPCHLVGDHNVKLDEVFFGPGPYCWFLGWRSFAVGLGVSALSH